MNPKKARARRLYAITRIDQLRSRNRSQRCWRVRLYWNVKRQRYDVEKNFPDLLWGGKQAALKAAMDFRESELGRYSSGNEARL